MSVGPAPMNERTEEFAAIESMERFSVNFLGKRGFRALGSLAERHGTWEIAFYKAGATSGELGRFVVVDMTGSMGPSYVVEFWAGAAEQPSGKFSRKWVATKDATPSELTHPPDPLKACLEEAIREAEAIQPSELANRQPSSLEEAFSR
jgi:hypothetical protein